MHDGRHPAYRGQVAEVTVVEGRRGFPGQTGADDRGDVAPHLFGGRGYAGDRFSCLLQRSQVTCDENVRMSGSTQVVEHGDTTGTIQWYCQ